MARRRTGDPDRATQPEARVIDDDLGAQELGPDLARPVARTSRGVLHRVHPVTGLAVVFLPGEALPAWVDLTEAEDASRPVLAGESVADEPGPGRDKRRGGDQATQAAEAELRG